MVEVEKGREAPPRPATYSEKKRREHVPRNAEWGISQCVGNCGLYDCGGVQPTAHVVGGIVGERLIVLKMWCS